EVVFNEFVQARTQLFARWLVAPFSNFGFFQCLNFTRYRLGHRADAALIPFATIPEIVPVNFAAFYYAHGRLLVGFFSQGKLHCSVSACSGLGSHTNSLHRTVARDTPVPLAPSLRLCLCL